VNIADYGADGYRGQLAVERGRSSGERAISGATCEEVVAAVGLFAAVALDLEVAGPAAMALDAPRDVPAAPAEPRVVPSSPAARRGISLDLGLGVALEPMLGPSASLAIVPFAGVEWNRPDDAQVAVAPRLRLGFVRTSETTDRAPAEVATRLTAGQLSVCPLRATLIDTLVLRPCVLAQGGLVEASGSGVRDAQSTKRFWLTTGAVAQLGWELGAGLALELEGGVAAAPLRYRFYVDPTNTLYEMPAVAGIGSAGLSFRWP
jgi:hypothetical protein